MPKRLRPVMLLFALSLLLAPIRAAPLAAKQVLVTVVADEKTPARGLTGADFTVVEDKATREVTGAMLADGRLSVMLLVDTSNPAPGAPIAANTRDLRQALMTFVKTIQSTAPDSQFSYGEFGGAAVIKVPFTAKTADLEQVMSKMYPDTRSDAVLLEALTDIGPLLAQTPPPRRAVVTIDFNSPETSRESQQKPAVESVEKAGATVWSVTIGSAGSKNAREAVLNALTQRSGGQRQTINDTTSLELRLKAVAHSLLSQYELTYVRPDNVKSVREIQIGTKQGLKALRTVWMR